MAVRQGGVFRRSSTVQQHAMAKVGRGPFVIAGASVEKWFPGVGSHISSAIALNGKHGEYPRYKTRPLPLVDTPDASPT